MCFSAPASFIAGGALSAAGVATLSKTRGKRMLPFASIPLLFGIQQAMEGVVWLSLSSTTVVNNLAALSYSLMAHAWWPLFTPLAILAMERDRRHRRILYGVAAIGAALSVYLAFAIGAHPVNAHIVGSSIQYFSPATYPFITVGAYFIATCGACLLSSSRLINSFGAALTAALAVALTFYLREFVSVWCFFAAILSVIVYVHVVRTRTYR